ncbi:heterodisulfide reductase-related iron-sulfur binding cluster [Knoellia sp. CPCC 206450]|uniref:heterodisulfide reductase-related iron-sulfur binding cluster n=1 Tax=Knoellia tibetensis TaxID=3404798 RepID=UPI003B4335A3
MSALQIVAAAICFPLMLVGWALLFRQIGRFVALYRVGQADPRRTDAPMSRTWTLAKEFLGHTRMSRLPVVAVAHWFTALSFMLLFGTLVNAFGQLIRPAWQLPVIGHFPPYEWLTEVFAWTGLVGIVVLIVIRQLKHPRSAAGVDGRRSRFFGSTWWQAYYVEATILGVTLCILTLRVLEAALTMVQHPEESIGLHFPLTGWLSGLFSGLSVGGLETWIVLVATVKILISFAWMITISLTPTMGVAWHRFLAFPNIWFKREASGRTALGNLKPMTMGDGRPFSMEAMEALEESEDEAAEPVLGVGKVEDFTWKGLLDFSTCTECGRCQSQCPAWNTDKPLSPKMLMMTLRDHADAKSPWLTASEEARASLPATTTALAEVPLIGQTGYDLDSPLTAYNALGFGPDGEPTAVIDEDVLWSCTTCGACVEQCPVDIEHVDHIVDMRRYQTLIESAFPSELGGLFKNLESKGNPWGMGARARLDWAKDLPFEVKILGKDVESASEVDWFFWVGCAGAYEDRAKKTTRAVAELLDTAGVSFAVLGDGETCTGDSARRAGNEILFSMLAEQNIETLNDAGAKKIVVTCAHCFNTIKNEYPDLGGRFEVVHHTQLLNRLVRDKKLVPVARPADAPGMSSAKNAASTAPSVTYHDPCYLGRHNNVYAPPRELIGALPGVELREMERSKEKSFCCGAGGARMWMEEKLGGRINMNRTEEALATGAERIAIGCPFCRVMISDGLTAKQSEGVGEDVEVVDVAQMLLAAVRRGSDDGAVEGSVDESAAAAVASESQSYAGQSGSAATSSAAVTGGAVAGGAAGSATTTEGEAPVAGTSSTEVSGGAAEADPWEEPAAPAAKTAQPEAPKAEVPAAAEADPWDEPAAPAKTAQPEAPKAEVPAAAEADPWDEPAAPAAKTEAPAAEAPAAADEADPWDEPAATTATTTKTEAPAVAAPAEDVDPWDEPSVPASKVETPATEAKASASEGAPSPEKMETAAAASTDDVDPWDEPGTAPAKSEESKDEAASSAAAPAASDDVDPWDEPATPAAQSATASVAVPDAATEAGTETPAAPASTDDVDRWDEPANPASKTDDSENDADAEAESTDKQPKPEPGKTEPAAAEDETTAAAAAATDDVGPWDEPATSAPVAEVPQSDAAPWTETSPSASDETSEHPVAESRESPDSAVPAGEDVANRDELLASPDPWDDASDLSERAGVTSDAATEVSNADADPLTAATSSDEAEAAEDTEPEQADEGSTDERSETESAPSETEPASSETESAPSETEPASSEADKAANEDAAPASGEDSESDSRTPEASAPPANADDLLNAPDPWD